MDVTALRDYLDVHRRWSPFGTTPNTAAESTADSSALQESVKLIECNKYFDLLFHFPSHIAILTNVVQKRSRYETASAARSKTLTNFTNSLTRESQQNDIIMRQ